jgi:hypothetical protein
VQLSRAVDETKQLSSVVKGRPDVEASVSGKSRVLSATYRIRVNPCARQTGELGRDDGGFLGQQRPVA